MRYDDVIMKDSIISPIFVDSTKKIKKATIQISSPYPQARASFNWLNVDFPYPHTHTHWELLIIIKGKLKHSINGYQEIASKGYACLIRPSDYHQLEYVENEKDTQHINFTFSKETAQALLNCYKNFPLNLQGDAPLHFFIENAFIDSVIKQALIAQSATKEVYEQHSILLVHQLITILFSQNLNANVAYPAWLNDFLYFLHSPECFNLSANELAKHTPYSYSRLSRIFKQYLGKTLVEHVNELKIVYAKRVLRTTKKSILDISLDLGYESVSSFNHNFKAITALTPSQYRKKYASIINEST
jgi:AraC family cel operon transcriptional repressor